MTGNMAGDAQCPFCNTGETGESNDNRLQIHRAIACQWRIHTCLFVTLSLK